jgi:SagB-type dehydrogenase family enzyme
MAGSLFLSLPEGTTLAPAGDTQVVVQTGDARFTLKQLTPAAREALQRVGDSGGYEEQLTEGVLQQDGAAGLSTFYYQLCQLGRRGSLLRSATDSGRRLATLVPTSAYFTYPGRETAADQPYVLSRFAYLRTEGGRAILESPLAHAQVRLHDWRAGALVHALAGPRRARDVAGHIPGLSDDGASLVMDLLLNADMIGAADESGTPATDRPAALQSWEFHDLLFHSRSRHGRHANPTGDTYRFAGKFASPPALKGGEPGRVSAGTADGVDLYRPDLDQLQRDDPPFARVQETRRSIREYAARPISDRQLGEFLFRIGRVKKRWKSDVPTPAGPIPVEFASRPYPSGGALYEQELYVGVNACENLGPGLYHYDPLRHRLDRLCGRTPEVERLLSDAAQAPGIPVEELQILLIVAARFQRLAWKYASMAYAVMLKHVGVLFQTMYLAATAMNLAPCGIGGGNADRFARAAGTDYYAETSVGEFLLGSKP